MAKTRNPQPTAAFLSEHYRYELDMLWHAYETAAGAGTQAALNMGIECFFLHARSLVDFYAGPRNSPQPDDAFAADFTATGTFTAKATAALPADMRDGINKQIQHLTYSRGTNKVDGADLTALLHAIEADHSMFKAQLAPAFVTAMVGELTIPVSNNPAGASSQPSTPR